MHPKPRVVISKCLTFDKCRYNGEVIPDKFVDKIKPFVEFITVCPEVEIGLGTPREPIRIVQLEGKNTLYQPATEKFFTDEMVSFTEDYLNSLKEIDGFILKNRSPSCGPADVKIFQGFNKSAMPSKGPGFFGGAVKDKFPALAIEDEGRLKNFQIRENFITKLFTLARFRGIRLTKKMGDLVDFHSRHKLLLLSYNQTHYRNCGRIVANLEKLQVDHVFENYEKELAHIFKKMPRFTAIINTLQHAFGWISDGLSTEEKKYFLNSIEEYRDERIPLSAVVRLIHGAAIRFNNTYLQNQVFLNPYPTELIEITDSGKGRSS
jgi:uncharacterized protein YbgA (DUF1722 family)/uncharacterized protein YbbK (DUF523 family)